MTLIGTEVRMMRSAANLWWAWLVAGIAWVIVSASVRAETMTIGRSVAC